MSNDPVQDFLISTERNLRLGAAVGDAWPEARNRLITGFFDQLEAKLTSELRGWKFERWRRFFLDWEAGFDIWYPPLNHTSIELRCADYGERIEFGVARDEKQIEKRPLSPQLLQAFRKRYPDASAKSWWEAMVTMKSPAPDWRKPDVLWRIHTDPTFLEEIADQFLGVAKDCGSIIKSLGPAK